LFFLRFSLWIPKARKTKALKRNILPIGMGFPIGLVGGKGCAPALTVKKMNVTAMMIVDNIVFIVIVDFGCCNKIEKHYFVCHSKVITNINLSDNRSE